MEIRRRSDQTTSLTIGDHAVAAVGILTFVTAIRGEDAIARVGSRSRDQPGAKPRGPGRHPSRAAEDQAIEFTREFGEVAEARITPLQLTGSPLDLLLDVLQGHVLPVSEGDSERGGQVALGRGGLLLPGEAEEAIG